MDSDGCRLGEEKLFEFLYKIEWFMCIIFIILLYLIFIIDYILI